eukprot:CAMPEP_0118659184 /NCGR_PEP_ID=MMETSP0785-20121206/14973_1 /TAXON_ID=91992 /ORGANISM="Bolidomonas pacifica, Strain CCMP 1866" /LENGTH=88 /DNA_ID=CAMNT_0006552265 /DNA_START=81 /DNA_END=344 /DNA_ORIENTATION=-
MTESLLTPAMPSPKRRSTMPPDLFRVLYSRLRVERSESRSLTLRTEPFTLLLTTWNFGFLLGLTEKGFGVGCLVDGRVPGLVGRWDVL